MRTLAMLFCLLCCFFLVSDLTAQPDQVDPSSLTLDRIITNREFVTKSYGPVRWLEDGSGFTALERSEGESRADEIVLYEPASGERKVLVPPSRLVPDGYNEPLIIDDYFWSPDGKRLLIFTNSERVWREYTRGDYWVLHLETGELHQVDEDAEPSMLMFAKFSPQGDRVAFVYDNDIYVEDLESGEINPVTTNGSETIINGTFDWVYEEELKVRDGFRWSPDGEKIAYWQINTLCVSTFYMINNTDDLYPSLIPISYPKAGECNPFCSVGIVSASGGKTKWMIVPDEITLSDHYIARMDWAGNSDEIVFQRLNRLQNRNEVVLGDAKTRKTRVIHTCKDEAWVNPVDDLFWLNNGEAFTWLSEWSGWRHLYKVSRNGEKFEPITSGDFDVISVEHIDAAGGWVYFIASPENPTQQFLFRTTIDKANEPERLTPANLQGTHSYQISPDAKWAIHSWSSFGIPPR
ncbi:MAG: DPP IV N-terminal domain-containing protein, partial [Planctomycetota bacterium]